VGRTTVEMCAVCGELEDDGELTPWFVGKTRRTVHTDCWIEAYEAKRRLDAILIG
jgi:hypothetical protein